jgi:hypothetical protein
MAKSCIKIHIAIAVLCIFNLILFKTVNLKSVEKFEDSESLMKKIDNLNNQIYSLEHDIKQQNVIYKKAEDDFSKNPNQSNKDEFEFQKQVNLQNQEMLQNMKHEREIYMKELGVDKVKEYKNTINYIQKNLHTKSQPASDFDDLYKKLDKDAHEDSSSSTSTPSSSSSSDNKNEDTDINNGKNIQNLLIIFTILILAMICINIIIPLVTKNKYIPAVIISLLNIGILIISFALLYSLLFGLKSNNVKAYLMSFVGYIISILGLITFSMCGIPNIKISFN